MKNIEKIIQYLSGEMLQDESEQFQKELSANPALLAEYETIAKIWKEFKKQLKLEESPDSKEREQLIAEIMAEHDVQFYKHDSETKKELAFKKKLRQSMINDQKPVKEKKRLGPRVISMVSLVAAAAITLMILILNPSPDLSMLTNQFYQPTEDPIFEPLQNRSRSDISSPMYLFTQGDYSAARLILMDAIKKYPDFTELKLLYALSCYESDDFVEAEINLWQIIETDSGEIAETSRWYLALLNLHSGENNEASLHLETIKENGEMYKKEAKKLLRKIK